MHLFCNARLSVVCAESQHCVVSPIWPGGQNTRVGIEILGVYVITGRVLEDHRGLPESCLSIEEKSSLAEEEIACVSLYARLSLFRAQLK